MSIFFETGVRRLRTSRTPVHWQTDGRWKTPQKTQSTLLCLYFSPTFLFVLFPTFSIFLFFCQYLTFLYPSISADTQFFFFLSADNWSFFIHWSRQSSCGNTPRVRVHLGTRWPGYELTWVRVDLGVKFRVRDDLGTSWPGYELTRFGPSYSDWWSLSWGVEPWAWPLEHFQNI